MTHDNSSPCNFKRVPSQVQVVNKLVLESLGYSEIHADAEGTEDHYILLDLLYNTGILQSLISDNQCLRNGCNSSVIDDLDGGSGGVKRLIYRESRNEVLIGSKYEAGLYKSKSRWRL